MQIANATANVQLPPPPSPEEVQGLREARVGGRGLGGITGQLQLPAHSAQVSQLPK